VGEKPPACTGCGKTHAGVCVLIDHPDYNKEAKSWSESMKGKMWAAKGKTTLPYNRCLDPADQAKWTPPPSGTATTATANTTKPKSESNDVHIKYLNTLKTINDIKNDPYKHLLNCKLHYLKHRIHCRALMDTGAEHANYMSGELAARLKFIGVGVQEIRSRVYGASSSLACIDINEKIIVPVTFYNEKTFCEEKLMLEFHIMEECKYDMIIGLQDIYRYDLVYKNESMFRIKENIMRLPLVGPFARPEPVVPGQDPVLVPSGRISMLEETRKVEHMSKFISREE
jgi:hypothetical protein